MRLFNNKKILLGLVFSASLFFSIVFLVFFSKIGPAQHAAPATDYRNTYEPMAENFLAGRGLILKGAAGVDAPGYPIILASIFTAAKIFNLNRLELITIINVLMAALAACFLYLIAQIFFSQRVGLISAFLWMTYPFNLWFLKNPNTEVPFILLFLLGLWLFLKGLKKNDLRLIFLSGLILSLASLIRAIGFLIPFILAILLIFLLKEKLLRTRVLLAGLMVSGAILTILPWEIYIGRFIPISTSGPASVLDGLTYALVPGTAGDEAGVPADVLQLMMRIKDANLKSGVAIFNFSFRELSNQPLPFLKLIGLKVVRSWYATSQKWWEGKILLGQLFYLLSAVAGIWLAFRKSFRREIIFLLVIILYTWLMTIMVLSIMRYMIPVMALVTIFSALALDFLFVYFLRKNRTNAF